VLSLRTSEEVKALLRAAAEKEHRSLSSMLEHMVYAYAERLGIEVTNAVAQKEQLREIN
jgi:uncharacterized protein (DUF1778 family)